MCITQRTWRDQQQQIDNGAKRISEGQFAEKDPASEQLIPSEKSTKLIFSFLQKNIPLAQALCFSHYRLKVIEGTIFVQLPINRFNS